MLSARVLALIRQSGASRNPIEQGGEEGLLSPSRLAHLFTEEFAVPFRR